MSRYYILEGHETREVPLEEWAEWLEANFHNRHVVDQESCGVRVSTVFIGLDYNFSGTGPPMIFETMIFGGRHDGECWRCSTWAEAEAQHDRARYLVEETTPPVKRQTIP